MGFTVPSPVQGSAITLTFPFTISFFSDLLRFGGDDYVRYGLVGAGLVDVTLVPRADDQAWLFQEAKWVLEPTPEPATLLLWSTGAAGLGLARWYRRRGREREHAA